MDFELVSWDELPQNMIDKYNVRYRSSGAIIPLVKDNKFSIYAKSCADNLSEKDMLNWIEYVYKEEKEILDYAHEIGDNFGWLKYYSSEYKRGYRLSRKVYVK